MIHRYLVAIVMTDDKPIDNDNLHYDDSGILRLQAFELLGDAMELCSQADTIPGQRSQLFVSVAE